MSFHPPSLSLPFCSLLLRSLYWLQGLLSICQSGSILQDWVGLTMGKSQFIISLSLSLFQTNINIHTSDPPLSHSSHTHTHTHVGTSLNPHSLLSLFPLSIFVQVLDREQHESQLILIPIESFHKEGEKGTTCYTFLLWKETSQYWINVRRVSLLFLDCPSLPLFTDLIL